MPTVVKLEMAGLSETLRACKLEPGGLAQQYLTNSCAQYMVDYMPYREGMLIKQMQIGILPEEGRIIVNAPQARYTYIGKVMEGVAPKKATDKDLQYTTQHNALAGPYWDKRMWADKGPIILEGLSKLTGGKVE